MITTRISDELMLVEFTEKREIGLIWVSDLHFDSKHSQWNKLKKYLEENQNSYIVLGGDSIDVMQFVKDLRGHKSADKYGSDDYANRVINEVKEEIVEKYKHRILCWNRGNHDNSIIRHHNIDMLQLICGLDIKIHEYSGYILLNFKIGKRKSNYLIHFSHSPESGGKRSKGALAIDIAKGQFPSADLWIREHIHDGFIHPIRHEIVSKDKRKIVNKNKWFIQNISLKDEHEGKRNGFHFEKNFGNSAVGFCKMKFTYNTHDKIMECNEVNHIIL